MCGANDPQNTPPDQLTQFSYLGPPAATDKPNRHDATLNAFRIGAMLDCLIPMS